MADAAEETPSQRQARIRREKREKKILAGGSDRLAKITNVSGRAAEPAPPSTLNPTATPDPEESDIGSTAFPSRPSPSPSRTPSNTFQQLQQPGMPSEADLRAFLRSQDQSAQPQSAGPQDGEPDMMALLRQLMGGPRAGGAPGDPAQNPFAAIGGPGGPGSPDPNALPPALASLLSGMGSAPPPRSPGARRAYTWKILHALSAFSLAGYILLTYPFSGTLASRSLDTSRYSLTPEGAGGAATGPAVGIFWLFATVQLVLQSSRFFLERGEGGEGMLGKVASFLPEVWGERVRVAGRYAGIWTTLVGDAMCVVFVLGVVAWWRGVGA
ncbi:MAG: hypothetical protein MMC23_008207 [Stictis urceolatum]|nr:hypothetical protein [Stictis urceolata]